MSYPPLSRRSMLAYATALGFAVPSLRVAAQTKYPVKPIRVVVPFGAGGGTDVIARAWAQRITKATGQSVVIDNKPGASTIIGAQAVATAPADGYTLMYTAINTISINPYVYSKLPYKIEDFVPLIHICTVPYALIVPADSRFKTLQDLIREAKANPGKLTYGHYGIGQGTHVAVVQLLNRAGITMTDVPYKGSAVNDLIGGQLDVLLDASTVVIPLLKAGRIRVLAVTGPQRLDSLPDVPAVNESMSGFASGSWHGVFAPKGTPKEAIAVLSGLSQKIVAAPDFRSTLHEFGLVPAGGTPEDFQKFLVDDGKAWAKVVKDNNIKVE